MKRIFLIMAVCCCSAMIANAQWKFDHLDFSLTGGSTGIGFDLAMPVVEDVQVRAGATFMPTFHKRMNFPIEIGEPNPSLSKDENAELQESRFEKLSGLLYDFMGVEVNNKVDMIGEPTFSNFKFLVDVFPFKENKKWYVTAGFFLGGNRFAKAYNTTEDMASLLGVVSYNSMYYKALAQEPLVSYGDMDVYFPELYDKIVGYGRMTMHVGDFSHDIYAKEDVYYDYTELDPDFLEPVIDANGREIKKGNLRYAKGEKMYSKGDPYRMVPDEDCMIKANAYVNCFRPYIGFGYGSFIDKDQRTSVSFDCGMMFWGGVPKVVTHDGVDLRNDLTNVRRSVQNYLNMINKFPVYPVLSLRITQRLF